MKSVVSTAALLLSTNLASLNIPTSTRERERDRQQSLESVIAQIFS